MIKDDLIRFENKKKIVEKAETKYEILDKNNNAIALLFLSKISYFVSAFSTIFFLFSNLIKSSFITPLSIKINSPLHIAK